MESMEPESADFDANFGALELEDSTTSSLSSTQAETKPVHEGVQKQADPTGLVDFIARLDVDPSVVRATTSCKALGNFGEALRSGGRCGPLQRLHLYLKSNSVEEIGEIQEFWSHSWHMAPWKKIMCLLMMKNGVAAGVLDTLAALFGGGFVFLGLLPLVRPAVLGVSIWSQVFGSLTFFPTLLWWRNNERVFLDCCCIDQRSAQKKVMALKSMAGILKQSQRLLVIWDPTYVQRFWCVFELAAFLKSHNGPEEVRIRPALLGPFAFVITCSLLVLTLEVSILTAYDIRGLDATLCTGLAVLLVMYCAASECRSYFRSLEIFGQQMTNLQLDKTACWCCSVNHKTSSGATVPCDREVVSECLRAWFGSVEECEVTLKALGADGLTDQLGRLLIPFQLILSCTSPILWLCVDMAVSYYASDSVSSAKHWLIASIGYWLGSTPTTAAWLFWVARKCWKPKHPGVDRLMSFLVLAAILPVFLVLFGFPAFLENQHLMPSWANVTSSTCILSLLGMTTWLGAKACDGQTTIRSIR